MTFLENELEDFVYSLLQYYKEIAKCRGFENDVMGFEYARQLNLGSYGIADIIGFYFYKIENVLHGRVQVIELKKDEINEKTLIQALRYAKGIERFVTQAYHQKCVLHFELILIGTEINDRSDFLFINDIFKNVSLYNVKFCPIKGLGFNTFKGYYQAKSVEKIADLSNFFPSINDGINLDDTGIDNKDEEE